jgi:hypothetical protein
MSKLSPEERRQYERDHYHKNKAKYLKRAKAWRDKNKEKIKLKDAAWLLKNPDYHKNYYLRNKEKWHARQVKRREKYRNNIDNFRVKTLAHQREYDKQLKQEVLEHYGGKPPRCACCGESNLPFLEIDHINGGGNKQIKVISGGARGLYLWLRKKKYPEGYQVLCCNCNHAKGGRKKRFCPVHHPEEYA